MDGSTEINESKLQYSVFAHCDGKKFSFHHFDESDHIIKQIRNTGHFYEEDLLTAAGQYLKKDDLVLDVGANIGNHAVFFAGVTGCKVVAFEPNPDASALLKTNISNNELDDRIDVVEVGIGAKKGKAYLAKVEGNLGATSLELGRRGHVEIRTLDSIDLPGPPRLLKIDVEGMELDVLQGARKTLTAHKPTICCEVASHKNLAEVRAYLEAFGYVSIESFCYTPTHFFVHVEVAEQLETTLSIVSRLSSNIALNHYEADHRLARIHRLLQGDIGRVEKQLSIEVAGLKSVMMSAVEVQDQELVASEIGKVLSRLETVHAATTQLGAIETHLFSVGERLQGIEGSAASLSGLEEKFGAETSKLSAALHELASDILTQIRNVIGDSIVDLAPEMARMRTSLESSEKQIEEKFDAIQSSIEANNSQLLPRFGLIEATIEQSLLPRLADIISAQVESADASRKTVRETASGIRRTIRAELQKTSEENADHLSDVTRIIVNQILPSFNTIQAGQDEAAHLLSELVSSGDDGFAAAGALLSRQKDGLQTELPPCQRADYRSEPASICFSRFTFEKGWENWRHHQSVQMSVPGTFVSKQARSTPGVDSPHIRTRMPGLYQVRIRAEFDASICRPFIRVVAAGSNELLGADARLTRGETVYRFYQPDRIDTIQMKVLLDGPAEGSKVTLQEVRLERVDMESHQRWVSGKVGAPVIASMATIPSRTRMLKDAVYTLLLQCDEVRVFMNNYESVPDFLDHPRIRIRRSQHWDDNGDAGKFGWVDDNDAPGYRVICDDDLLFPPDLVERLAGKVQETDDRAMVGLHGVMLRQPITQYYAPNSRHAVHFQSRMDSPKLVQILATCVMCYHSSQMKLKRDDFMFRNMADVWLSAYAKNNGIPLMIIDRPFKWVRQNTQEGGFETIYENSLKRTKSNFDSSYIQDAVLKAVAPLTIQKLDREFCAMIVSTDSKDALHAFLKNFDQQRDQSKEWLIILVLSGQSGELRDAVQTMPFRHELHIVDPPSRDPQDIAEALSELLSKLSYDIAYFATDRLRFNNDDWCRLPDEENWLSKTDFLAFECDGASLKPASGTATWPDFCIFSKAAEKDFARPPARPSARASAGESIRSLRSFLPVLGRPDAKVQLQEETGAGLVVTLAARALQDCILNTDPDGVIESLPIAAPSILKTVHGSKGINDVFDRVVVLNLDRRPDRWTTACQRLDSVGVKAERFRAIDGGWPEVAEEYREYSMRPLREFAREPGKLGRSRDFYLYARSESQRTAYLEQRDQSKAIARPGAWGYLKSMIGILEAAITDGVENLLVFDDDIILHRRFNEIFAEAMGELPADWRILQLGTLQYDWDRRWMHWYSKHLYSSQGSAIGSHAVGLRREILPFLLERSKRLEMPYDIGPLSAAVRASKTRNFIIYPNIAIQDMADSDISSSTYQERARLEQVFQQYRWQPGDYEM